MLGEATTTELHRDRDSQGMAPLKKDAQDGGAVAGRTRKDIEVQTGKSVISGGNFKKLSARKPKKLNAPPPAVSTPYDMRKNKKLVVKKSSRD